MITNLHVCQDCGLPFEACKQFVSDCSMPWQQRIICITGAYTGVNGDSGPGYSRDFMSIVNPMLLFFSLRGTLVSPFPSGEATELLERDIILMFVVWVIFEVEPRTVFVLWMLYNFVSCAFYASKLFVTKICCWCSQTRTEPWEGSRTVNCDGEGQVM